MIRNCSKPASSFSESPIEYSKVYSGAHIAGVERPKLKSRAKLRRLRSEATHIVEQIDVERLERSDVLA